MGFIEKKIQIKQEQLLPLHHRLSQLDAPGLFQRASAIGVSEPSAAVHFQLGYLSLSSWGQTASSMFGAPLSPPGSWSGNGASVRAGFER